MGEICNQSKLEDGIEKINDLKKFYFIGNKSDVEVRTVADGEDIDLVIKVIKIR